MPEIIVVALIQAIGTIVVVLLGWALTKHTKGIRQQVKTNNGMTLGEQVESIVTNQDVLIKSQQATANLTTLRHDILDQRLTTHEMDDKEQFRSLTQGLEKIYNKLETPTDDVVE
jgi:hypothetical protein